jgi:hypothetical protein
MTPTLVVAPEGRTFRTISAALDEAPPGATVEVRAGLYEESLVLERPVRLIASGRVIVHGGDQSALTVLGDRVRVRGLVLRGEGPESVVSLAEGAEARVVECVVVAGKAAPAVTVSGGAPRLVRCRTEGGAAGVVILGEGAPRLIDCELVGSAGAGVELMPGARARLRGGAVRGHAAGVRVGPGGRARLREVRVVNNAGGGVVVEHDALVKFISCEMEENGGGDVITAEGGRVVYAAG